MQLPQSAELLWTACRRRSSLLTRLLPRPPSPLPQGPNGSLQPATWGEALSAVKAGLAGKPGSKLKVIAGKLADAESLVAAKDLFNRLGCGSLWHEGGFPELPSDLRASYVANTTVAGLEAADVVLLIGTNPRLEAPVYNARLRKVRGAGGAGLAVSLLAACCLQPAKYAAVIW